MGLLKDNLMEQADDNYDGDIEAVIELLEEEKKEDEENDE